LIDPVLPPLHNTGEGTAVAVNKFGSLILNDVTFVQLFASVEVTVYVPATKPVRSSVVAPFDQTKV
jgi:hypothetical protein